MLSSPNDVPLSLKEVELLFGKSKKAVWWAVQKETIKARQSVVSENWIVSYNSCVALWGEPVASLVAQEILEDWNGA